MCQIVAVVVAVVVVCACMFVCVCVCEGGGGVGVGIRGVCKRNGTFFDVGEEGVLLDLNKRVAGAYSFIRVSWKCLEERGVSKE